MAKIKIHVNDVTKQNVNSRGPEPPYSPFEVHIAEGNIPNTSLLIFIGDGSDVVSSLEQTLDGSLEHGRPPDGTTLAYKNFADVKISLHDAGETRVVDSVGFCASGIWLEKHFRATETHSADKNEVSVRENIGFLLVGFRRRLELNVVIHAEVAQHLMNVVNRPLLRDSKEGVPALSDVRHRALCEITAEQKERMAWCRACIRGWVLCATACAPKRTVTRQPGSPRTWRAR